MLSGKHKLTVPLDTADDRLLAAPQGLKFHQDLDGEGLEGRASWAHVACKTAMARLSKESPERDPDMQAASRALQFLLGSWDGAPLDP